MYGLLLRPNARSPMFPTRFIPRYGLTGEIMIRSNGQRSLLRTLNGQTWMNSSGPISMSGLTMTGSNMEMIPLTDGPIRIHRI